MKYPIFRQAFIFILFFEVVSFVGFLIPSVSTAVFLALMVLEAVLAVKRFDLAVMVLLAELFIGSQGGYGVSYGPGQGIDVSLRLGLFLVVFSVWAATTVSALFARDAARRARGLQWLALMRKGRLLWPYLALLAAFAMAAAGGILRGNGFGNVFFDANGYAFFALFPAMIGAFADPTLRRRLPQLLFAAVSVSVLKALFVLFVFTHRMFFVAPYIYTWVRDTRVGEITKMLGDFYRVFFQAHLFALVVFLMLLPAVAYAADWKDRRTRLLMAMGAWALTGVVMGFSRSFWFGAFFALLGLAGLLVWSKATVRVWKRVTLLGLAGTVVAATIILALYYFPFPRKGEAISFAALFGSRATSLDDSAANSRWALLPILWEADMRHPVVGSGFGTTVTYKTSDPRLLADIPTGEYTTFAFEWGYHDLLLKLGLIGVAVYAWLIAAILVPLVRAVRRGRDQFREPGRLEGQKEKAVLAAGIFLSLIALLATNVFSPYLNHPLGIGILMLAAAYGAVGAVGDSNTEPTALG